MAKKKQGRYICGSCGGDRFKTVKKGLEWKCRSCGATQGMAAVR